MTPAEAASAYRDGMLAGTWRAEMSTVLIQSSIDQPALRAAMDEVNEDPRVAAVLAAMVAGRRAPPDGDSR